MEPNQELASAEEEREAVLPRKESGLSGLYDWVSAAIFALVLVTLVFSFCFRIVEVDGSSMNPTLWDAERLITSRIAYTPQRGDIVIINRYTKEPLVKRIVAVGGDRLRIDEDGGGVYVNGEKLDEPYTQGVTYPLHFGTEEQVVPEGCVFVMGDNRQNSTDSRYMEEVGFVKESDLIGKAVFRFLPLSRFGGLYD
ncbi:MAG TPA: signal peptidase I [Firmicutes bacterium]|nr:signal peptidase I [Bacillota bacterium]